MNLVEQASWQVEIAESAPVKLDLASIEVPENTQLTFVAINHGGTSDYDYIGDLLSETDVFFPELMCWTPLVAKNFQKVSKGDYRARQSLLLNSAGNSTQFIEPLIKQLYDSKVDVRMADLSHSSSLIKKFVTNIYRGEALSPSLFGDMAARDNHIAHQIGAELINAQKENPRLRDKIVRATAIFGVGHLSVEAALQETARQKSVASFSSRLLFDNFAANNHAPDIIAYNNWLRSAE
jgi:hypothetical protein